MFQNNCIIKNPRVSICIPTFNRASMVGLAIDSALNQTYKDIEVVVVDNASTDNIEEVIAEYKDPRLRLIKNNKNIGIFGNFNRCVEVSKGEFLHILHSDDYIEPEFIETCINFFDAHQQVALTFTSKIIHTKDAVKEYIFADSNVIFNPPDGFKRLLKNGNFINCPSVIIRKSVYEVIGNYSLEYPYAGDYYQWLKIAKTYGIAHVCGTIMHYRIGEHSESFQYLIKNPVGYLDVLKIIFSVIKDLGDERKEYIKDINGFAYNRIRSTIMMGFIAEYQIYSLNSSFFSGISLLYWSLVKSESSVYTIKKYGLLFLILGSTVCMYIKPVRKLIGRMIQRKRKIASFQL